MIVEFVSEVPPKCPKMVLLGARQLGASKTTVAVVTSWFLISCLMISPVELPTYNAGTL